MNIFDQAVQQAMEEIGTILDPTLSIQNKAADAKAAGDAVKAAINKIASPHDEEEFYSRGDICNYGGKIYICIAPEGTIIQGDFFENQWSEIPSIGDFVAHTRVKFADPNNDGHIVVTLE